MTATVPDWLRGLWRRRSIEYPDGRRDDTTLVYWLQTESAFADIRIPADRPGLRAHRGFDSLSAADIGALARQAGFAGWSELDGDVCRWHRMVDYQPATGVPDEGRLERRDGVVIETGVHEPYVEVWEQIGGHSSGPTGNGVHLEGRAGEMLVAWGPAFIYVRDRGAPLPRADSFTALVDEAHGRREEIAQLLNCEISFGTRPNAGCPWKIELSTLPWREGEPFDPAVLAER